MSNDGTLMTQKEWINADHGWTTADCHCLLPTAKW